MIGRDGFLRIIYFDKSFDYSEQKKIDPTICYYEDRISLINKINYQDGRNISRDGAFHDFFEKDKNNYLMREFLLLIGDFNSSKPKFTFNQLKNCNYSQQDYDYWEFLVAKEEKY